MVACDVQSPHSAYCPVHDLFFALERNNATVEEDIFGATLFPSTHDYLTDLRCYCTELFWYFCVFLRII